ncbi:MAG: DUF4266 domain-containing protein [Sandaracinaceae bacterium]
MRSPRTLLAIATVCSVLLGCAGARPWERGDLASPKMQFEPDPEATLMEQHVYQYREGSAGGYGGGGGGCGCN